MSLSIIVAMDRNGLIGNGNELPWHIPADLKYFREVTEGNTVIMGRNTYESIGKALPDRKNVVLSQDTDFNPHDALVFRSLDEIFANMQNDEFGEYFVIGGANVFSQFLPYTDTLYITHIEHEFQGDIYFPSYKQNDFELGLLSHNFKSEDTLYQLKFCIYERIKNKI